MERRVVILGGGGDGSVVAEAIRQAEAAGSKTRLMGFLNDNAAPGQEIYGVPVLGKLGDWQRLDTGIMLVWALHRVGLMQERVRRFQELAIPENRFTSIRHPQSVVASTAKVCIGSFIASYVTIQPMAFIGPFSSIRAGASVGHHAEVGPHAYVGPNATLCGHARMEMGACLGPNAALLEHKTLAQYSLAGICAAVTKDVPPGVAVAGNPARRVPVIRPAIVTDAVNAGQLEPTEEEL